MLSISIEETGMESTKPMVGSVAAVVAGYEVIVYRVGVRVVETGVKLSAIVFDGRTILVT